MKYKPLHPATFFFVTNFPGQGEGGLLTSSPLDSLLILEKKLGCVLFSGIVTETMVFRSRP